MSGRPGWWHKVKSEVLEECSEHIQLQVKNSRTTAGASTIRALKKILDFSIYSF